MIVIKCIECGNVFNNNEKACNKCGCPVEVGQKRYCSDCGNEVNPMDNICNKCINQNEEKIKQNSFIMKSNRTKSLEVYFKICAILGFLAGGFLIFTTLYFWVLLPITVVVIMLGLYIYRLTYELAKKTVIQFDDKKLIGEYYKLFKVNRVNFPLSKITSVRTISLFKIIKILIIVSDSGKSIVLFLVDNADEFRDNLINQLTK